MLDAAREAQTFIKGRNRDDLETDRMLTLSLLKEIEIIGEAAANISKDAREQIPQLPWGAIVAMRNRLVHVYFDIDLNLVWATVTNDLSVLIPQLEKIILDAES